MRKIKKGSIDRSVDVYIIDSVDGTPEVGVLWNTAGIDLKYRRNLEAVVAVTEATLAALTTAHTDGGFLEIGNGVYRFDLPDAAWATGADHVVVFGTVTGMIVLPQTIQLVDYDPEDTVRLGLTSLPSAGTLAVNPILAGVTHTGAVIPTVTTVTGLTPATVHSDLDDIQVRLPAALVGGKMDSNTSAIDGNAAAAANLKQSTLGIATAIVGTGSTTTSIVTSSMSPAAAVIDQFKGRIVSFAEDTTTVNLRGQSTDITANTAAGVLTVTALTTAPVSGDTFSIT